MSLFKVFDIAGSGMSAQSVRLNLTASNRPEDAYRARHPVFQSVLEDESAASVRTAGVVESAADAEARYAPGHPMADEKGYVYASNVNPMEEMANMISASRSFQQNVEVMNTSSSRASVDMADFCMALSTPFPQVDP